MRSIKFQNFDQKHQMEYIESNIQNIEEQRINDPII